MKRLVWICVLLGLGCLFWWRGVLSLDPDFGWHIRTGEWIRESRRVPREDGYSFTREGYSWVDHEWGSEVVMSWLYDKIGYVGLAGVFAIFAVASLAMGLEVGRRNWINLLVLVLAGGVILPYVGVRPQVVSWMMLAFLLRWLSLADVWLEMSVLRTPDRKILLRGGGSQRFWLRPCQPYTNFSSPASTYSRQNLLMIATFAVVFVCLLILWSNLHGGSVVGLAVLVLILISNFQFSIFNQFLKIRSGILIGFVVFLSIVGIQIFNPYGLGVYREIGLIMRDSKLRWRIAEWLPMARLDLPFMMFSGLTIALVWLFKNKLEMWEVAGVVGLLAMAMSSQRHAPLFVVFALPVVARCGRLLMEELGEKKRERLEVAVKMMGVGVLVAVFVQIWQVYGKVAGMSENRFYPVGAVNWLRNASQKRTFNYYGWGGYLIWKMPGQKWFVDGRMASWEGVMDEYGKVVWGEDEAMSILDKYGVERVVWQKDTNNQFPIIQFPIISIFANWVGMDSEKGEGIIETIKRMGWVKVYADEVVQVWEL